MPDAVDFFIPTEIQEYKSFIPLSWRPLENAAQLLGISIGDLWELHCQGVVRCILFVGPSKKTYCVHDDDLAHLLREMSAEKNSKPLLCPVFFAQV